MVIASPRQIIIDVSAMMITNPITMEWNAFQNHPIRTRLFNDPTTLLMYAKISLVSSLILEKNDSRKKNLKPTMKNPCKGAVCVNLNGGIKTYFCECKRGFKRVSHQECEAMVSPFFITNSCHQLLST